MNAQHVFGGDWTEKKLTCLQKYLVAYRQIFTKNAKARFFKTWYVDAFAGTGARTSLEAEPSSLSLFPDVYQEAEPAAYREGSARKALSLEQPFDHYLFIEKSKARSADLRATVERDFSNLQSRCQFETGDANDVLRAWCAAQNWTKTRAVVFLDPYGMQVQWNTIELLAETKGVDLWYLFPVGIGVARLLKKDANIPADWQRALDSLFGTSEWSQRFYTPGQPDLLGDTTYERDASIENIEGFIHERLAQRFAGVAKGLVLRNSRESPMYLLCFAAANPVGASTACRIAKQILDK